MSETTQQSNTSYSAVAVLLHWVMAFFLIAQILYGWSMEDMSKAARFAAIQNHKSMGLTLFALAVLRLIWRLVNPPPPYEAGLKPYEKTLAHLTHIGFYGAMIAIPLTGYIMISASAYKIATKFWGLFTVPVLPLSGLPNTHGIHETFEVGHSLFVWGLVLLLALHLAAVAKHTFIDKDGTLARMVPLLKNK